MAHDAAYENAAVAIDGARLHPSDLDRLRHDRLRGGRLREATSPMTKPTRVAWTEGLVCLNPLRSSGPGPRGLGIARWDDFGPHPPAWRPPSDPPCRGPMACSAVMDTQQFWKLIEEARSRVPAPDNGDAVAEQAAALLALRPPREIIAADRILSGLMADSYRSPLWGAAYVINGGCSDDGFDYFRGWLITQGRETFERIIADPDALAGLPAVRAFAADGLDIWCEEALSIAWTAHQTATGEELPNDGFSIRLPDLDPDWNFDFDDREEMSRRLPRLTKLYPE